MTSKGPFQPKLFYDKMISHPHPVPRALSRLLAAVGLAQSGSLHDARSWALMSGLQEFSAAIPNLPYLPPFLDPAHVP